MIISKDKMAQLIKEVDGAENLTDEQLKDMCDMFAAYNQEYIHDYTILLAIQFLKTRPDLQAF